MNRHLLRGQALVESAITLPLLILALLLMIAVVRVAVIYERSLLGIRIAGTITNDQNPYRAFSFDTAYQSYDNFYNAATNDDLACTAPQPQTLTYGGLFSNVPNVPMYSALSTPTTSCTAKRVTIQKLSVGASAPLVLNQIDYSMNVSALGFPSFLGMLAPQAMTLSATAHFFAVPSLETLVQCNPALGVPLKASVRPTIPLLGSTIIPPLTDGQVASLRTSLIVQPKQCTLFAVQDHPYAVPASPMPVLIQPGATPTPDYGPPPSSGNPGGPQGGSSGGSGTFNG